MRHQTWPVFLLVPLLAACEHRDPTAPDATTRGITSLKPASSGATTYYESFGPFEIFFPFTPACLGEQVLVVGTLSGSDRVVERPDGSVHITEHMDVSDVRITLGNQVWTPGPNASEIFIKDFPPGVPPEALLLARHAEHLGVVIYRADDGRPALRLHHRLQILRLPGGELQVFRNVFDIDCIAPDR